MSKPALKYHRIICLGNPNPKQYKNNPQPPGDLGLELLEIFATDVCGLDISTVPQIGDTVRTQPSDEHPEGEPLYEVTEEHRAAKLRDLIATPVEIRYIGPKRRTKIRVSRESSLVQAVAEIRRCWAQSANCEPAWIAGTDPLLVEAVKQEFGIEEVREYQPDETDEDSQ